MLFADGNITENKKLYLNTISGIDCVHKALYLCVGAVLPLAFATGEQISLSTAGSGHLVVPDRFFGQILPHFFQLITGHFLQKEGQSLKSNICFDWLF